MAAFMHFRSTCFSEHPKVDPLLSNWAIFFSEYFKESPKKTHTFILTSMMRGNSIISFYAATLQKLFFTDET